MKILCISDTHGFHEELKIIDVDMIIHAGDFSNTRSSSINANECIKFLEWYEKLSIKYKILISGNHDTAVQAGLINFKYYKTIIYAQHEMIEIGKLKIFGSPYTPTFGVGWAFNVPRHKLDVYWREIPKETDILVTHGPPKGILDLSYNEYDNLEYCGDKSLLNKVYEVCPKYHIFGHIHNNKDNFNWGKRIINDITFMNVSAVTDGKFNLGLTSKGIIIDI